VPHYLFNTTKKNNAYKTVLISSTGLNSLNNLLPAIFYINVSPEVQDHPSVTMMLVIFGIILCIIFLGVLILKFVVGNHNLWAKQNIYQVQNSQVFSFLDRFLFRTPFQDQDLYLYKAFKKVKDLKYAGTVLFRHSILYILDLDLVKNILVKAFDHFVNRRGIEFSDAKFHEMLFNMVNQDWKDLRTTMSPTFITSKIKRMFEVFNESADRMATSLKAEIEKNYVTTTNQLRYVTSYFLQQYFGSYCSRTINPSVCLSIRASTGRVFLRYFLSCSGLFLSEPVIRIKML